MNSDKESAVSQSNKIDNATESQKNITTNNTYYHCHKAISNTKLQRMEKSPLQSLDVLSGESIHWSSQNGN